MGSGWYGMEPLYFNIPEYAIKKMRESLTCSPFVPGMEHSIKPKNLQTQKETEKG